MSLQFFLILGGLAFSFTFADQASTQKMYNGGMIGTGNMMITQEQYSRNPVLYICNI
jgi:hypothetical protein